MKRDRLRVFFYLIFLAGFYSSCCYSILKISEEDKEQLYILFQDFKSLDNFLYQGSARNIAAVLKNERLASSDGDYVLSLEPIPGCGDWKPTKREIKYPETIVLYL